MPSRHTACALFAGSSHPRATFPQCPRAGSTAAGASAGEAERRIASLLCSLPVPSLIKIKSFSQPGFKSPSWATHKSDRSAPHHSRDPRRPFRERRGSQPRRSGLVLARLLQHLDRQSQQADNNRTPRHVYHPLFCFHWSFMEQIFIFLILVRALSAVPPIFPIAEILWNPFRLRASACRFFRSERTKAS